MITISPSLALLSPPLGVCPGRLCAGRGAFLISWSVMADVSLPKLGMCGVWAGRVGVAWPMQRGDQASWVRMRSARSLGAGWVDRKLLELSPDRAASFSSALTQA